MRKKVKVIESALTEIQTAHLAGKPDVVSAQLNVARLACYELGKAMRIHTELNGE